MSTGPNLTDAVWVTSSYSTSEGGECVEFAPSHATCGTVPVRDSKAPGGPALLIPADAWSGFVTTLKQDDRLP